MRIKDLPSALERREEISEALCGRRAVVFLDYDGTLTPIVERPELAVMSQSMRETVRALADTCPVAVISGRDRPVVEDFVRLDTLYYAGSHGFDIAGPDGKEIRHEVGKDFAPLLAEVRKRLEAGLGGLEGALIEGKRFSLAVHYRLVAPERAGEVKKLVGELLAEHADLKMTPGKMVFELQPKIEWHKGMAVNWLLKALELDGGGVLPIFLGDDITDEDAFREVSATGIGILVAGTGADISEHETAARYILQGVGEVEQFLKNIAGAQSSRAQS